MVGVGKNDCGPGGTDLIRGHGFDGPMSSYGHESGCVEGSMTRLDVPRASGAGLGDKTKGESGHVSMLAGFNSGLT